MENNQEKDELLKKIEQLETQIFLLEKNLIHDKLTGLKTRTFFEDAVRAYIDLIKNGDNEKRRKATFVGEDVLKEVSQKIVKILREDDITARWGGDEFAIVLVGVGQSDAVKKAWEICSNISNISFPDTVGLKVSVAIGVVTMKEGFSLEKIVELADKA